MGQSERTKLSVPQGRRAGRRGLWIASSLALLAAPMGAVSQELRGHGGPVRAVAVSADGAFAATGSFDTAVILWRLREGSADAVLRFHEGPVNAVAALPDGRFASAGEDGRIALWRIGRAEPEAVIGPLGSPVNAMAISPDGVRLAAARMDAAVSVFALADGRETRFPVAGGQVNGVAFLATGDLVATNAAGALSVWRAPGENRLTLTGFPSPGAVVAAPDGEIAFAAADGKLRFVREGAVSAEIAIGETPLVALALSRDGSAVAAGGIRGNVAIVERAAKRVRANLVGPGLPVWSLAFSADGRELLSGGADRLVRRWNALTGEHIGQVVPRAAENVLAPFQGERGAQVFRACAACHTLTPDDGNRAGPTLHGVMGRRIATAPGYNFSPALKGMDIVWTRDTIARLFEIGPNAMTPGTKMPEQVITNADDRRALVDWLEKVTR